MRTLGAVMLSLLLVASFVGFIATHTVHANLATESFYVRALSSSRIYDRLYDELLTDPEFAPQLDELLGGVNVKRADLVATVKQLVKPEYLEAAITAIVHHLVIHVAAGGKLDLSVDITPIVASIHDVALRAAAHELEALPVKQADSYEAFVEQFEQVIKLMRGEGAFPEAIPTYPIPPDQQDAVAAVLIDAGGLDDREPEQAKVIAAIREAISADDVARAIRVSSNTLLERLIGESTQALTHNEVVSEVDGHYLLHPTETTTNAIDRKREVIHRLDAAAAWARVAARAAIVICACALVLLYRNDRRRRLAWPGGAFFAAGALGFLGWLIARGPITRALTEVAAHKALPATFRQILADVVDQSIGGLTPTIWIPSIIAAGLGAALLLAAARTAATRADRPR